jgi:hypothetical protein
LWNNATGATGPGGATVVISDFGTTVKNNSAAGIAFINAWTASTISGVGGYNDTNASWRVLSTGGSGGGTFTGGTVTGATIFTNGLTANTITSTSYNGYNPLPTQAAISSGVTLSFITDTVYGTLLIPENGFSISADTTNGQLGVTDIIIHSGSTPTFSSQYKKLSGSSDYSAGTINYIFCTYISSDEIIYSINQRT